MQQDWQPSTEGLDVPARDEKLALHPVVVLHIWAAWNLVDRTCDDRLKPVRNAFSGQVVFGAIDADDPGHRPLLEGCRVSSLPAILCFIRGSHVETIIGLRSSGELQDRVSGWLAQASCPPPCRAACRTGPVRSRRRSMFAWFRRKRALAPEVVVEPGTVHQHPERCPLNVPGPFYTTGHCLACESPEHEAPDLLAPLDDENSTTYFVRQPQTEDEIERACRAIEVCCVNDLRYGGSDPRILERLNNDEQTCDIVLRDGRLVLSKTASHA